MAWCNTLSVIILKNNPFIDFLLLQRRRENVIWKKISKSFRGSTYETSDLLSYFSLTRRCLTSLTLPENAWKWSRSRLFFGEFLSVSKIRSNPNSLLGSPLNIFLCCNAKYSASNLTTRGTFFNPHGATFNFLSDLDLRYQFGSKPHNFNIRTGFIIPISLKPHRSLSDKITATVRPKLQSRLDNDRERERKPHALHAISFLPNKLVAD